jgi:hypothetical protein
VKFTLYDAFSVLPFLGSSRKPTIKRKSVKEQVLLVIPGLINKPRAVESPKNTVSLIA